MPAQLKVSLVNAAEIRRAFKLAPDIYARHLQTAVRTATEMYAGEVERKAPKDSGTLSKSVRRDVGILHAEIYPTSKYAIFVHEGTGARSKMPPFGPDSSLAAWARRHGTSPFLVARAIKRKGTKAQPFMTQAWTATMMPINALFIRAHERATEEIANT